MSKFQLILTGVFALFIIIGVIIFSSYRGSSKNAAEVEVWGTISQSDFDGVLKDTGLDRSEAYKIKYIEKTEEEFDSDFIEALASGGGPDLFMLPNDKILKHRNKIFPIPYEVFTERQFRDSFIYGTDIYMASEGILGLPILVDPLVMYWNRAIFADAKLTNPPEYWDEFYNLAATISKKDGSLNIQKSAVAFGEFDNISNAKEIILNLAMQAGTPVTKWNGASVQSLFSSALGKPTVPAEAAVNFYTEFSNPSKSSYSWNRSLSNSTKYFLGGDLALYFGFANEISMLQLKNPNLNFDVAAMPISREGGENVSFAYFDALAITKSSAKKSTAFAVASILSGKEGATAFSKYVGLPPARNDLLSKKQTDAYKSVFYESAIRAKSWLDPSPTDTDSVFGNMIKSITSGKARTAEAVLQADREISSLLLK